MFLIMVYHTVLIGDFGFAQLPRLQTHIALRQINVLTLLLVLQKAICNGFTVI